MRPSNNVVVMTEDSQCPDCQTLNKLPRYGAHEADKLKCPACGAIYWNVERVACSCDAARFMVIAEISDSGGVLLSCLGCGQVADSRDLEEFIGSAHQEEGQ